MDQEYGIITYDPYSENVSLLCEQVAYDNFSSYGCETYVLEELFPDEDDYTDEQYAEAAEVEHEYYSWSIEEYNEDSHGDWDWYEIILDEEEE